MKRYLFCISFNGTNYCGWQVQKNGISVQEVVQDAIERVVGVRGNIVSCSRTDSKVHANNFYFHVDLSINFDLKRFQFAINNALPLDICLKEIKIVDKSFHARYSVKKKEYIYKIWNNNIRNPFLKGLVLNYGLKIDLEKIKKAAKFFLGEHDFTSFCNVKSDVKDKVRTIYSIDIFFEGDILIFKIIGDGFLYNMVRIIVGTLLEVSEGKIDALDIEKIIEKKDRKYAGKTIKADGLYLNDVIY